MSVFVFIGLIFATSLTLAYLAIAAYNRKRPELNDAIIIFLGAGGIVSAVRIIGAVVTGEFSRISTPSNAHSIWSLVPDDGVQIVLGGISLAWVSIQTLISSFGEVCRANPRSNLSASSEGRELPETSEPEKLQNRDEPPRDGAAG